MAKWLRHWIVIPAFAGSIPVIRPIFITYKITSIYSLSYLISKILYYIGINKASGNSLLASINNAAVNVNKAVKRTGAVER